MDFSVIGKATPKRDGAEKVTGRTRFLGDLELPRLTHGKIVRAPFPHARIVGIDVVEVNPALDVRNRTGEVAVELIESMLGKSTLQR